MGILAVDSIKSRTVAPVTVSDDLNVTGVSTVGVLTATSVVVGSAVTVNADGVITSGIVTATTFQGNFNGTTGTFSGDVSIGGTLTYEDVERVDATGLSTFREGLNVGSPTGVGGTFNPQGDISAGIGSFSGAISGGALSGTTGTFTATASDVATFTSNQTSSTIYVKDTDGDGIFISGSSAYGHRIYTNTTESLKLGTNSTERLQINNSGDLLVGTSTSRTINSHIPKVQVTGYDYGDSTVSIINNEANANGAYLFFGKQRSGGPGGSTVVQANDIVGELRFNAGDGTDLDSLSSRIIASIDDTPGGNDVPGRLEFYTTSNGQSSSTERLRIDSRGSFVFSNGALLEKCNITAGKLSDNTNIDLVDGMVHYFTTQESTTSTPNIRVSSAVTLNGIMTAGDIITVTLITTAAAGGYSAQFTIDGNAVTETWVGGAAPTAGGSSGLDVYGLTIICIHASNTGDSGFKVLANVTNLA